jgi:ABC-type dipeptide/oligopeptide/nickel transport system permease component
MTRAGTVAFAVLRIVIASLGVVTLVFFALRVAGDPVAIAMPPGTPLDVQEIYRKAWGLDGSLWEQYMRFIARLWRGDLGPSIAFDRPALEVIGDHLGTTLKLMAGAFAVAVSYAYLNALFFWVSVDKRRYARPAAILGSVNAVLFALSDFVLAILAIVVFGLLLGVSFSPETGRFNLLIGAFCVGLPFAAYFSLVSRRLAQQHIRDPRVQFFTDATSTGRSNFHVLFLPTLMRQLWSLLLLRFVWLAAGTFVVESVLGIRGMGYLTIRSVAQRDLNITQGVVLFIAILSVMANVAADAIEQSTRSRPN